MKKLFTCLVILFNLKCVSQTEFCLNSAPALPNAVFDCSQFTSADFNNDGKSDICALALTQFSPGSFGIQILLATGNGSFSSQQGIFVSTSSVTAVQIRDFNTDGNLDIAAISANSNSLYLLPGLGNGSFSTISTFSLNGTPVAITSGDFNNDGKPDIVTADTSSNGISLLLNSGGGNFNPVINYSLNIVPKLLVAGDFNLNSTLDLFVTSQSNSIFLKNNSAASFTTSSGFNLSADNIIVTDFNYDTKPDLIYTDLTNAKVVALAGNGNFLFGQAWSYTTPGIAKALAMADLNGDSKKDLAIISSFSTISVFPATSLGGFSGPLTYSANIYTQQTMNGIDDIVIMDIDGNSKPDIVALSIEGPTPDVYFEIFLNCNTVGLAELPSQNMDSKIFPNPANSFVNIGLLNGLSFTDLKTLAIYNSLGEIVYTKELDNSKTSLNLDLSFLDSGVYFIAIRNIGDRSLRKKIIVEH